MRIYKHHNLDWLAECDEHGLTIATSDWDLAWESAIGHVVVAHPMTEAQAEAFFARRFHVEPKQ